MIIVCISSPGISVAVQQLQILSGWVWRQLERDQRYRGFKNNK